MTFTVSADEHYLLLNMASQVTVNFDENNLNIFLFSSID